MVFTELEITKVVLNNVREEHRFLPLNWLQTIEFVIFYVLVLLTYVSRRYINSKLNGGSNLAHEVCSGTKLAKLAIK